jgi:hypothetical protein
VEDGVRKLFILTLAGSALLAGCGTLGTDVPDKPVPAKWKAPYHIEFQTAAVKPNPSGVALPPINYASLSKAPERRAVMVIRLADTGAKSDKPRIDQIIMGPVDIPDPSGALPSAYIESADKGLAKLLGDACLKGQVKVNLALVRSSIKPDADEAEINAKRLTEWLTTDVVYKNPHPKC